MVLWVCFAICYWGFGVICPKHKRGQAANRFTAVVALLVFIASAANGFYFSSQTPFPTFNYLEFLSGGLLVGTVAMWAVYGIAQLIHWVAKGKAM